MIHRITTISDARRVVSNWTERYAEQLTESEMDTVARALVNFIGGYGNEYNSEEMEFTHPIFEDAQ